MKAINYILAIAVLTLSACSSGYQATSSHDDIYYESNDKYLNDYSYEEEETYQEVEETKQDQGQSTMTNKYESSDPYSGQEAAPESETYRDGSGTTVINNYYDAPYDYYYSSRIRRFHRPYTGFGYYSGGYTDYRRYDPYYNGVSIYFSWGTPWYATTPGYYRYFHYPYHSYHYNSWRYDPWYSPYGYGGSYGSYGSGYRHGYSHGFYDGYYYGSSPYYGGYSQYGYSENSGYNPTEYHYGPRYAMSSNSGMREGRSEVKYGKDDGKSGSSTVGSRGRAGEEKLANDRSVKEAANDISRTDQVENNQGKRTADVFNRDRSNEVKNNSGLKSSHRSVGGQEGSPRGGENVSPVSGQSANSLNRSGESKVNRSAESSDNKEVRRNDFIQNRSYSDERKGYSTSTTRQSQERSRGADYKPMNRNTTESNTGARQNPRSNTRDQNVGRTPERTPERNTNRYNSGERNSNAQENRDYREERNSRNYTPPTRSSDPKRNYSPPKRNNSKSAPKRNYSPPKRNSNSGNSYNSNSGSRNSNSKSYSKPSRSRSSGSSGGSRGGSINKSGSSSPSNSNSSGGGRRHR